MAQSMHTASYSNAAAGPQSGAASSLGRVNGQGSQMSGSSAKEGDGENEGSGGDSSGEGMQDGSDDEADAEALSGVAKLSMEPNGRVAGSKDNRQGEDSEMMDETEDYTSAGADQTSIADPSDDNDYTGLSAMSDDGESLAGDENAILEAAEEDLKKEFLAKEQKELAAGMERERGQEAVPEIDFTAAMEEEDDFLGLNAEINLDEDPFQGAQLFDPTWQDMWGAAEMDIWRMPNSDHQHDHTMEQSNSRTKRVRFQDGVNQARSPSRSSSSSDSDDEDEADEGSKHFPDIFMDQEDPQIKKLLASDFDDDFYGHDSDAGSVYDFDDDADKFAFDMDEESDSSSEESESDSDDDEAGYETEDDTIEEKRAKMEQARKAMQASQVASTNATASMSAPATPKGNKRRASAPTRSNSVSKVTSPSRVRKGPRKGTFFCDPSKATIVSDATGKKTVLYMPTEPSAKHKAFWDRARSAATSRDSSPRGSMSITLQNGGNKDDLPARPFTAQSTLSTMFNGSFDFMQSSDMASPARTTPRASFHRPSYSQPSLTPAMSTFTSATTDEASDPGDDYQDFDMLINLDQNSDNDDEPSWSAAPTHVASPVEEPTFLSRGMVGSFRLNQDRAKQESSLPLDPASRASTSEHNALQSGRRGAGNTPITPARKKRISKDLTRTGSGIRKPTTPTMSSPLASRRRSRGQSLSGRLDQTLAPAYNF